MAAPKQIRGIAVTRPVVLRTLRADAELTIGNDVGLSGTVVCAATRVTIGDNCLIGANVTIADTDFHPLAAENRRHSLQGVQSQPVVLAAPFYMFSQQELAPAEDQGVVFSIVQASANATIDQTKLFAQEIHDVYRAIPETASIFQITLPNGGFGGMVTKPWSARTKTAQQLLMGTYALIGGAVLFGIAVRARS